jgi:hypothetical protein
MRPGDLIVVRTSSIVSKHALVVEIAGDGYVRVLLEGQIMWVPVSYTEVIDESR